MYISPNVYIDDARNFQQHGRYDLAIDALKKAQQLDIKNVYEVEIQKLLSFNYRKIEDLDLALFHINNAIHSIKPASEQVERKQDRKEYAICLMNKGIIYEEKKAHEKSTVCYLQALDIFTELFDSEPENFGIIINGLLTIGLHYYNQQKFKLAEEFLLRAVPYFGDGRESDRRYLEIEKILSDINTTNWGQDKRYDQESL